MRILDLIFIDKSTALHCFNQQIATDKLAYIAEACNKCLFPTVLCPWGCLDASSWYTQNRFIDPTILDEM